MHGIINLNLKFNDFNIKRTYAPNKLSLKTQVEMYKFTIFYNYLV